MLLTAAAYARGLHGEFEFDDLHAVESNPAIRHVENYFHLAPWLGMLRSDRATADLTFALNYTIGGLDPFPYHVTNLAIHLLAVVFVYTLARRLLTLGGLANTAPLSLAAAALFALHPLQTQAVVYVSQRAESLASLFYALSLLLLLEAEGRGWGRAGISLYLAAIASFVLALGTKSTVITLPCAYLLVGMLPGRADNKLARPAKRLALAAPLVLLSVLVVLHTFPALKAKKAGLEVAGFSVPSLPPWRYFLTEWHVLITYLRLLFWPAGQNLDWDFPLARGLGDVVVLVCGLGIVALLSAAIGAFLRHRTRTDQKAASGRVVAFGLLWFFLLLAPTSSAVPLADVLMEHRIYLASVGVFLAAVVAADHAIARTTLWARKWIVVALLVTVGSTLAGLTYLRVGVWRSKLLMWADVAAKSPGKARAHLGLGNAYRLAGRPAPAIDEYLRAVKLSASDPIWIRSRIYEKLALARLDQGQAAEAIAIAQAGLAEEPNHSALLGALAMAYLQKGELPLAEAAAEKSAQTSAKPAASLALLGLVRAQMGNQPGAAAALEQSVSQDPDLLQGRLLLAEAYRAQGRAQEACRVLRDGRGPASELRAQLDQALADCPPR